jgi:tRNA pseudouridine32 synthase / 23S rRNA pseudouridine746 synthase
MKVFRGQVSKIFPQGAPLGEVLTSMSRLELSVAKDAAEKGAVWRQKRGKGKILRERNIATSLHPQDLIIFNYDPKVLSLKTPIPPRLIFETKHYGVWYKPAGMVSQGTQSGDHTSLLRFTELHRKRETFLIHRLDRETMGVVLIGYSSEGAHLLSELFQKNEVRKIYQARVSGSMPQGSKQTINASLDGKESITHIEVLKQFETECLLQAELETGRLHQIRRHLDFIGHPVMGDPKYGKNNKNKSGLQLLSKSISFYDPWDKSLKTYECVESLDNS